jgi:hypothetical protein
MFRTPSITSMTFSDVSLFAYMNQADKPLASTRGHLVDHYGLNVANFDAWMSKLRAENVTFLEQPYKVGDYRAVMIEGPSHEAIELIEIQIAERRTALFARICAQSSSPRRTRGHRGILFL